MTFFTTACAAGAILLASSASAFAGQTTARVIPVPGTNGAFVYDGRTPPTCDARDTRLRHFAGDGHPDAHADHAHLGHGHKWAGRNHKGQPVKPPCYVRRVSERADAVIGGRS